MLHRLAVSQVFARNYGHVDHDLRQLFHSLLECVQALLLFDDGFQHLQGRDYAVTGGGYVAAHNVARGFAAERPVVFFHGFDHVAVTDFGTHKGNTQGLHTQFETVVGHQRAHHTGTTAVMFLVVGGDNEEQLVAVDHFTFIVDKHHAIAVAIKGNPHVGAGFAYLCLQLLQPGRAAV